MGRPTLSGRAGTGRSPVPQVRLPQDLDALLIERAEAEHRRPSEIVREALAAYLSA
ncbi:ribbon-helix-helix protein, CopG family [Cryobacterium aureum]|uniref:ribbon-helix-helix protein, CopG family n=1 Tax=Cryobacterium aureum TaxID=995037 RepID=UPI000CF3C6F5